MPAVPQTRPRFNRQGWRFCLPPGSQPSFEELARAPELAVKGPSGPTRAHGSKGVPSRCSSNDATQGPPDISPAERRLRIIFRKGAFSASGKQPPPSRLLSRYRLVPVTAPNLFRRDPFPNFLSFQSRRESLQVAKS